MYLAPRRFSFMQMLAITVLGVAGGIYIWKPVFEQKLNPQQADQSEISHEEGEQKS